MIPTTVVIGVTFINKKVLLKLSSIIEFSQNSTIVTMITVAPHHRYICSHKQCGLLDIVYWCGLLLFYPL